MNARPWIGRWFRWMVLATAAAMTAAGARAAAADDWEKLDSSLKMIPADAAFYSSMSGMREQFDAVKNSRAWATIRAMPLVQKVFDDFKAEAAQAGTGPAQLMAALENPEVRKAVDLLVEMASHEIFAYGDASFVDFLEVLQAINGAQSFAPLMAQLGGGVDAESSGKVQAAAAIAALAQHADRVKIPGLVVGFKVKNVDLAKEQLIKLEMIANILSENSELTKGRVKKVNVGDAAYLVFELDGSMLPWDEISTAQLTDVGAAEEDAEKVLELVKKSKLVVAVGLRGEHLLVCAGSSLEALEKLGRGDRLIDRPEFKPLAKHLGRKLVSLGYASEALNARMNNQPQSLDNLLQSAEQLLPQSGLDDAQQERIRKDARRLAADLKALLPEPGAVMTMTFVADQGFESFQYAWGGHAGLDGSKPLGLLEHVGGDPLLGFVARQKVDPKGYDLLVQWLKTAHGYFRDFGLPLMDEDDRAKIESFAEAAMPWFERLDKANREMLFPALADGQMALVVDARLTSKQYLAALPATEKPLPMLEPALILGLSDAKLFEKALGEYREIVNGLIEAMRQVEGVEIPEFFKIPEPETTEAAGGKIFGFPLPVEWGVDPQIVPNLALSDKVCVLSASRAHSERLMKATPPALGGVLARTDRPLALAAWFRWSSLLEAAAPWIDFAVDQVLAEQGDDTEAKAIVDQVRAVVSVLGTLRTVTDEGYIEDGALVHHSLVEIRDVEK